MEKMKLDLQFFANASCEVSVIETINQAGNYSTFKVTAKLTTGSQTYNSAAYMQGSYSGGASGTLSKRTFSIGKSDSHSETWEIKVYHKSDGTLPNIKFSIKWYVTSSNTSNGTTTKTITPTFIPRKANLTSAPNFNDEENPTINYSNPAGAAVEKLQACIASSDGLTIYVPYRDITKVGSEGETTLSYTFNLTTAEKNALRNATPNSNELKVKFYIETTLNGVIQEPRSSLEKTLTIKNPSPTLNPTAADEGVNSFTLTGDANKIIKYWNYVKVNSGGAAVKGATIKSQKIVCGSKSINSGSGYFSNVETADFTFSITDSRGNTTTQTLKKTLINYVKLTCNLATKNPTTDGKMYFKISGNYFNGSFGKVANTLLVQYRYKQDDGAWGNWTNATATKSGNTYSAEVNLTGLDYRSVYTFQARAQDELWKAENNFVATSEKKVKSIPVFDWGENDFQFNVDAFDKNGNKLGSEITAVNQKAVSQSGKQLLESGFVSITPVANTPTYAKINYQRTYKKIPTIVLSVNSSVPGTQVLGYGFNSNSTTGANIYVTRINTIPTIVYFFVFGEAE